MLPNVKLHSYVVQLIRKNAAKAEVFEKKIITSKTHFRPEESFVNNLRENL